MNDRETAAEMRTVMVQRTKATGERLRHGY
jgi:hypothetical protein